MVPKTTQSAVSAMENKELTNTHLRYLLAIYELGRGGSAVGSAQGAGMLGVSKPSVNRMLTVLAEQELVAKERYGKIVLTDLGINVAKHYQERLDMLMQRIPDMGLDLDQQTVEAAAIALVTVLPGHYFGKS